MLISLKWLNAYVPLTLPLKELTDRLTLAGVKVEKTIAQGDDWDGVRVAHVVAVEPHPNADRLRLVTVDVGSERPQVVCGAPNVAVGQNIAYAAIGTRLRDGHTGEWATLKAAKIRGVESTGMVCSEKELGLSDQHEGILVLPEEAPVGTPLREYMGDTILEAFGPPDKILMGMPTVIIGEVGSGTASSSSSSVAPGSPAAGGQAGWSGHPQCCHPEPGGHQSRGFDRASGL